MKVILWLLVCFGAFGGLCLLAPWAALVLYLGSWAIAGILYFALPKAEPK